MLKLLLTFSLLTGSFLQSAIYESNNGYILSYQPLVYDDFILSIACPEWQPRRYYYGIVPSSIGYFYVNSWAGDIGIYGSNRYVAEDNPDSFYESLQPLEQNLLPYATPSAGNGVARILSEEMTTISNLPAKRVVFELSLPNQRDEIVISYVFTKTKKGLFSNSILGYTYSVSCYKSEYENKKEQLEKVISSLKMR